MDIASFILSIVAFLMSGTVLILHLAKHYSSHTIQYVPAESVMPGKSKAMDDDFEEFDAPTTLDLAIDQATKNRKITA